jgi:hypothetical protein
LVFVGLCSSAKSAAGNANRSAAFLPAERKVKNMARVWYIENEEGTHAIIGEYSACGMAFDELNGVETTSPIVTCDDCVDNIHLLRRVQTRRRTQLAPDAAYCDCHPSPITIGGRCVNCMLPVKRLAGKA